jgi:hypothetical protein
VESAIASSTGEQRRRVRPRWRRYLIAAIVVLSTLGVLVPAASSVEGEAGRWLDDVESHLDHAVQRILIVGYRVDGAGSGVSPDVRVDALPCREPVTVVGYGPFWLPISTVEVRCGSVATVAGL